MIHRLASSDSPGPVHNTYADIKDVPHFERCTVSCFRFFILGGRSYDIDRSRRIHTFVLDACSLLPHPAINVHHNRFLVVADCWPIEHHGYGLPVQLDF